MATEDAIPAEPTRAEEIAYLKYLSNSFASDPWITIHPKMYQPSPHRLWYKNIVEYKYQYRKTFLKNFFYSMIMALPATLL